VHGEQEMQAMTDLLTATRVGEILHLDRSTVTRMAADGRIPAVKIGRQWRFRAADVRRLLDSPSLGEAAASLPEERTERPGRPVRTRGSSRIPEDVATALAEVAATSLGVMMVVTDMDGRPITPVLNPCPSFLAGADEPDTISRCAAEWRVLADDVELRPRFASGDLGFQCARAFVRSGRELVGMVLAGGVAAPDQDPTGLYDLDDEARDRVLDALPSVATALSRLVPTVDEVPPPPPR
jgi:excisionase family DNA binding protein